MSAEKKFVGVLDTSVASAVDASGAIDPNVGATNKHGSAAFFELNTPTQSGRPQRLPAIGLGVYQAPAGSETQESVLNALAVGYRHIDTARIYGNEQDVGIAVRKSGVPREEIFITTKLWNSDHGYDKTIAACEASLQRLGLGYIDLYLIHWPVQGLRLDTWRAMETLLEQGKVRNIGVSNYMVRHLEELLAKCKIKPSVNQIELSPYNTREDVVALCKKHGIVVEAYSPLTKGIKLNDPALVKIAQHYNVTTAQLLLRFCLQYGTVILPKSVKKERVQQNMDVWGFHISDEHMKQLKALNINLATGWDPVDAA